MFAMCLSFQCKTYACIMDSHLMGLTIDFSMGFVCFDAATKVQPSVLIYSSRINMHDLIKLCIVWYV